MGVDEISSGPDRPRRRMSRGVTVGLALAVVAALWISHRPSRPDPLAVPTPSPTTVATSTAPSVAAPTPSTVLPVVVDAELRGTAAPLPPGLRLLIGGAHPVDVGGRPSRLAGLQLRTGERVGLVRPVADGLVVQVMHAMLSESAPGSDVYWVRRGRSTLVTSADEVVVTPTGDAVFALTYGPPDGTGTTPAAETLRRVTLTGAVVGVHAVPAGFTLAADTDAGLLVAIYPATGGAGLGQLRLVNERTLRVVEALGPVGRVVTADAHRAAWASTDCEPSCTVAIEDFTTHRIATVSAAAGYSIGAGAVSPDGRRIALGYYGRHGQLSPAAGQGFVEVIDIGTGTRHRLPGVATAIKQTADLAWTSDGGQLVVSVGLPTPDKRRVGLWSSAGGRLQVLPGGFSDSGSPSALSVS